YSHHRKRVQNLIHSCLQFNNLVKTGTIFSKNLYSHLKHIKTRASIVWLAITINAVFYGLLPLAMPGRHLPEDNQVIYGLEPMFESPNFEIAYVVMGICVYICALFLANVTALNLVILGYVEAQMITLSIELQNLWKNAECFCETHASSYIKDEVMKNHIKNRFTNECLKDIVLFHIHNVSIIKEFEDVFRVTKAIELMCIIFSIVTELLGGIENTYLQMTCTFVLIFIESLAGQKLMDASCMFEKAVYDCNWENFDKSNMKIVAIILPSAQKTLNITAGGMTVLNFTCFLSVIKFSYSVYNTLRLKV
ncbi:uncharacterized protein LOC110993736, partial [Pieris rapae]|uniref:uncharacterized protein LOC110993736 n=1 Tax=Pieris rapae TaxID=64459 RepID=UPI001E2806A0